ncbi:UNVERIFIED_CONTAM: hypothetical protein O8I53_11825 [Campylobacter lari]
MLIIFNGSTTLPFDLDIFSPLASKTKPWLNNCLYGAFDVYATELINDELNQPRY